MDQSRIEQIIRRRVLLPGRRQRQLLVPIDPRKRRRVVDRGRPGNGHLDELLEDGVGAEVERLGVGRRLPLLGDVVPRWAEAALRRDGEGPKGRADDDGV